MTAPYRPPRFGPAMGTAPQQSPLLRILASLRGGAATASRTPAPDPGRYAMLARARMARFGPPGLRQSQGLPPGLARPPGVPARPATMLPPGSMPGHTGPPPASGPPPQRPMAHFGGGPMYMRASRQPMIFGNR